MDRKYNKFKRIVCLSSVVICLNRFLSSNIEIGLIFIHLIIIILCFMNFFIIPWKIIDNPLFFLRIVILSFLAISLISVCFNLICRKRKKLKFTRYYFAFYGSFISVFLIILDFLFILISLIIVYNKIKNYKEKKYDYKSLLTIDIFCLIILIPIFFFWYAEILNIYTELEYDKSLKDYIEEKRRFYASQNAKIINVEMGGNYDRNINNEEIQGQNLYNDETISNNNKIEMSNEKKIGEKKKNNSINNDIHPPNNSSK